MKIQLLLLAVLLSLLVADAFGDKMRKMKKYHRRHRTTTTTTTESEPEVEESNEDGDKDMFSILQQDEEAEEKKKKAEAEEEEQESKDEPSREVIKDNEIPLHVLSLCAQTTMRPGAPIAKSIRCAAGAIRKWTVAREKNTSTFTLSTMESAVTCQDWLFNIMRDLADRQELTPHYLKMEREAETNLTRRWSNAAVWKWCDLDGHPHDNSVSRHELFPIRAPLMALEHCIAPFLDSCDVDDDHRINLKEWGKCLELDQDDLEEKCDELRDD
ncbi:hypothetical protein C0J52_23664 [Blattella germanica]|nr:hypothetical protein C0J52_23664 [Blattella germanica]